METHEIKMLRDEIKSLRDQISDLRAAQENDRKEAIAAIREVYTSAYQYIADIYDYLWPVVHKNFPEYAKTRKQLDAIIKRGNKTGGNKKIH